MLGKQIQQVLLVYATHMTFWVWVLVFAVGHVGTFLVMDSGGASALGFLAIVQGMIGYEIGRTLAVQFADPRARLTPGFAKAHLLAAGGLAVFALSAVLLIGIVHRAPIYREISLSVAAMGLAILIPVNKGRIEHGSRLLHALWLLGIAIGLFLLLVLPVLCDRMLAAAISSMPLPIAAGCLGLVAFIASCFRLVTLCEDSPGYLAMIDGSDWDTEIAPSKDHQSIRRATDMASHSQRSSLHDFALEIMLRGQCGLRPWRRLILLQIAHGTPFLKVLSMCAIFLCIACAMTATTGHRGLSDQQELFYLALLPLAFTTIASAKSWTMRRDWLSWDFLLPACRKAFVRDMAISNYLEMAVAAASHCLVILAFVMFADSQPSAGFVMEWLTLTITQYMVVYALIFWIYSFGSSCLTIIIMGLACLVLPAITTAMLGSPTSPGHWHAGTMIVLTLSVLSAFGLDRLARRRWRQIDFDG